MAACFIKLKQLYQGKKKNVSMTTKDSMCVETIIQLWDFKDTST